MNVQFAEPIQSELRQTATKTDHVPTLDILRGVAILGLLIVSIRSFGLTQGQVGQLLRGPHGGNYWLFRLTHLLADHKLRALLSMLFGAGLLLLATKRTGPDGLTAPDLFIRRQLWLIGFGLLNAIVLLCPNDILFQYGIVGVFLFPFQRLSTRGLLIGAVVTGLIFSVKGYWAYAEQRATFTKYQTVVSLEKKNKKVKLTDDQKEDKATWEGTVKGSAFNKNRDSTDRVSMRADYGMVWRYMLPRIQGQESSVFYRTGLWDIASMMLLGMALFRWGFFTNRLTTRHYAALAIGGAALGLLLAWLSWPSYTLKTVNFATLISSGTLPLCDILLPAERAFLAIGGASLVVWLYRSGVGAGLWRAVASVGQLALSNYLIQTILCTTFFYGYGMGHFGNLSLAQLYMVVAEIWLIQLVSSAIWLRFFRTGPAEWLWRSLVHGRRLPIRRTEPMPSDTPVLS